MRAQETRAGGRFLAEERGAFTIPSQPGTPQADSGLSLGAQPAPRLYPLAEIARFHASFLAWLRAHALTCAERC